MSTVEFSTALLLGVCIIDDDRLIDDIDDLEGAFIAWQVCLFSVVYDVHVYLFSFVTSDLT